MVVKTAGLIKYFRTVKQHKIQIHLSRKKQSEVDLYFEESFDLINQRFCASDIWFFFEPLPDNRGLFLVTQGIISYRN